MSLVWNYRLDDVATSVVDTEGLVANATNVGSVVSFTDPEYGEVAQFSTSNYLNLASAPAVLIGSGARSVSFWFNLISTDANTNVLFSSGTDSVGQRFRVEVHPTGFIAQDINGVNGISSVALPTGTWVHIVTQHDGASSMTTSIDGTVAVSMTNAVNTATTEFNLGRDHTADGDSSVTGFNGYMSDFRVYDYEVTSAEITAIFTDGPNLPPLKLTLYTHIADLEWASVDGATTYSIRKTVAGGLDEIDVVVDTTALLHTDYDVTAATAYVYNLYTDTSPTVVVETLSETSPVIDSTSVGLLLTRVSNDITILTVDASDAIESTLRDVLATGDALETTRGSVTFVENSGTLALPFGSVEKVLLPFDTGFVGTQGATITLPDLTDEVLGYDEGADEVIYDTVNYAIGEYFKSGTYKVTVIEL